MKKLAAVAALTIPASLGVTAPSAAASYNDQMVQWNDCKTYERYGPFWGRVLLGGNDPARFPPCGPRPVDTTRAKYFGPALRK